MNRQTNVPGQTLGGPIAASVTEATAPMNPGNPSPGNQVIQNYLNSKSITAPVSTPYGTVIVNLGKGFVGNAPGIVAKSIAKNVTISVPVSSKSNGYSIIGTQDYTYALQNGKLATVPTTSNMQIAYNGVPIATAKNGIVSATGAYSQPVYGNVSGKNQLLGTMNYTASSSNGNIGLNFASFTPARVTLVQGGYFFNGVPTSYNAKTGTINFDTSQFQSGGSIALLPYNSPIRSYSNFNPNESVPAGQVPPGFGLNALGQPSASYNVPLSKVLSVSTSSNAQNAKPFFSTEYVTMPNQQGKFISVPIFGEVNAGQFSPLSFGTLGHTSYSYFSQGYTFTATPLPLGGGLSISYDLGGKAKTQTVGKSSYSLVGSMESALGMSQPTTTSVAPTFSYGAKQSSFGANLLGSSSLQTATGIGLSTLKLSPTLPLQSQQNSQPALAYSTSIPSVLSPPQTRSQYLSLSESSQTTESKPLKYGFSLKLPTSTTANYSKMDLLLSNPNYATTTSTITGQSVKKYGLPSPLGPNALNRAVGLELEAAPAIALILAAPEAALPAIGISLASSEGVNYVLTGHTLSTTGAIKVADFGALSGGILGAFAPEAATAGQIAKFVAGKTIQTGIEFSLFSSAYNFLETGVNQVFSMFGGGVSGTNGTTSTLQQSPSELKVLTTGAQSKMQPNLSYTLDNASSYINAIGGGALQGFAFGTEYAGPSELLSVGIGAASKSGSTVIKALTSKLTLSTISSQISGLYTIAQGGTPTQVATSEAFGFIIPYAGLSIGEGLNKQINPIPKGEPSVGTTLVSAKAINYGDTGLAVTKGGIPATDLVSLQNMKPGELGATVFKGGTPIEYANARMTVTFSGVSKTLTSESAAGAQQTFFTGGIAEVVSRTEATSPLRTILGIGPKVTESSFSVVTPRGITTEITEAGQPLTLGLKRGIVIPGELRGSFVATTESSDVGGFLRFTGKTAIGREFSGQTGDVIGFNKEGTAMNIRPLKFQIYENEALPSYEELRNPKPIADLGKGYTGPKTLFKTETVPEQSTPLQITPKTEETSTATPTQAPANAKGNVFTVQRQLSSQIGIPLDLGDIINTVQRTPTETSPPSLIPLLGTGIISLTGLDPLITNGPSLQINRTQQTRQTSTTTNTKLFPTFVNPQAVSTSLMNKITSTDLTSTASTTKTATTTKQTQTQKQPTQAPPNAPPTVLMPPPVSDIFNFPRFMFAPGKRKNGDKATPIVHIFKQQKTGYVSDLSHALLNITGGKTMIGLSRPIPRVRKGAKK